MIPLRDDQPTRAFPFVTLLIIAVNAYVFIAWQLHIGVEESVDLAGFLPIELTSHAAGGWVHVFTAMFMHGGWMHLIGNMWFLWLFGDNVEDALGPARYLLFYFLVGTLGALAQCYAMPSSTAPMIGASGAVAGALGAYVMLYPRARIDTLIMIPLLWPVIKVRAWVYLGLWFVGQFLLEAGSGVAWMAHVGGFIAGAGLVRILAPRQVAPPVEVEYIPPPRRS